MTDERTDPLAPFKEQLEQAKRDLVKATANLSAAQEQYAQAADRLGDSDLDRYNDAYVSGLRPAHGFVGGGDGCLHDLTPNSAKATYCGEPRSVHPNE